MTMRPLTNVEAAIAAAEGKKVKAREGVLKDISPYYSEGNPV